MKPLHLTQPGELPGALMENELLRQEVRILRAKLVAAGAAPGPRGRSAKAAASQGATAVQQPDDQAREDLVWLLRRLDESPAGFVLRRIEGFRVLRARYLAGPDT